MQTIRLTKEYSAIVDDDIYTTVAQYVWYVTKFSNKQYATRKVGSKTIYMHRFIMERLLDRPLRKTEVIDHIDNDGLNNQVSNLRIVTTSQNRMNSKKYVNSKSDYIGVHFNKRYSAPYRIKIMVDGKNIHSNRGYYDPVEAAEARDLLAVKYAGEHCSLNFPEKRQEYIDKIASGYEPEIKDRKYESSEPGISNPRGTRWQATIWIPGEKRQIHVGYFATEEEAIAARMDKLKELGIPYKRRITKV